MILLNISVVRIARTSCPGIKVKRPFIIVFNYVPTQLGVLIYFDIALSNTRSFDELIRLVYYDITAVRTHNVSMSHKP